MANTSARLQTAAIEGHRTQGSTPEEGHFGLGRSWVLHSSVVDLRPLSDRPERRRCSCHFDGLRVGVSPASWRPEPSRDGSAVLVLRRGIVVDHLRVGDRTADSVALASRYRSARSGRAGGAMLVRRADGYRLPPPPRRPSRHPAGSRAGRPAARAARDPRRAGVGWCGVAPPGAVPGLDRPFRTRRVDHFAVWSISCFYIRKWHRRIGIMTALITAAVNTRAPRAHWRSRPIHSTVPCHPAPQRVATSRLSSGPDSSRLPADHPNGQSCASNSPAIASEGGSPSRHGRSPSW